MFRNLAAWGYPSSKNTFDSLAKGYIDFKILNQTLILTISHIQAEQQVYISFFSPLFLIGDIYLSLTNLQLTNRLNQKQHSLPLDVHSRTSVRKNSSRKLVHSHMTKLASKTEWSTNLPNVLFIQHIKKQTYTEMKMLQNVIYEISESHVLTTLPNQLL